MNLAARIDHTILKPDTTLSQIEQICQEALQYHFASVCINPMYVPFAAELLQGSSTKVCTVIGFPLGATCSESKANEASLAVRNGAQELDMVMAIGAAKSGNWEYVEQDIAAVCQVRSHAIVKVILETCLLNDEEIVQACLCAYRAGAQFVKTSTGFSTGGATLHDVMLMKKTIGASMKIKASGGIRTYEEACAMIEAGASRIGTSSGPKIIVSSNSTEPINKEES